jgi:4-hydroxy-3-polyprenylbenzoate decarboxylase
MEAVALGITGASGIAYGLRLARAILEAGLRLHLVMSRSAFKVLAHEEGVAMDHQAPNLEQLLGQTRNVEWHRRDAIDAAPASGSAGIRATIICPCSMGTLARIANGYSSNLIERMADVAIKEGRSLVLVPRETPLSVIHLRNMLRLARAGALILPAAPGFYHRPQSIEDLIDFVCAKILDRLGIDSPLIRRWRTPAAVQEPAP